MAKPKASPAKSDLEHPSIESYKPGQLVLSKARNYPPWPAVVIPLAYCPKDVKKKFKRDAILVKYLNDPTWYWNSYKTISPLTREMLQDFRAESKAGTHMSSDDPVMEKAFSDAVAYQALSSKALEKLLRENNLLSKDEEYIEYESWLEEKKKPETVKKSGRKSSVAMSKESTEEPPRKKKVKQPTPEKKKPTFEELANRAVWFRSKLQRGLIQRRTDPTEAELSSISNVFKDLENFSDSINSDLLKVSKIHKVLKAITRVETLKRPDDYKFHDRSIDLILKWEPYIAELKSEKSNGDLNDTPNSTFEVHDHSSSPKKENGDKKEILKEEGNGNEAEKPLPKGEVKEESTDKSKETKEDSKQQMNEESKEEVKEESNELAKEALNEQEEKKEGGEAIAEKDGNESNKPVESGA